MKKKIIPVCVAIVLICVIVMAVLVPKILDRYSYTKERADLMEHFGVSGDAAAIFLQDEKLTDTALVRDGRVYFTYGTVSAYMEDRFYVNRDEMVLKYSLPDAVHTVYLEAEPDAWYIGSPDSSETTRMQEDFTIAFYEGDLLYLAADFVDNYCSMTYALYTDPYRVQLYTAVDQVTIASVSKNTAVRVLGGIKSPILADISEGDTLVVLNRMDTWSEVKTQDCVIGYIETKYLRDMEDITRNELSDYTDPEYVQLSRDHKIVMAWQAMVTSDGNSMFSGLVQNADCLNVVSPTWLMLNGNEGEFVNLSSSSYVEQAHNKGMEVWVLAEDITYNVDMTELLSSTPKREQLENALVNAVLAVGADGLNIDFEHIAGDCGPHFAQFLRELSILTHKHGLVLSVDNYVPRGGRTQYNLAEQGIVVDYVIIMGYDEHWAGCGEAGSVASIGYVEQGISDTINQFHVPAQKVINAVPLYTRIWETSGAQVTDTAVGMQAALDWIATYGASVTWDETTCQNYAQLQGSSTYYQIWLEDSESLQVKLNIMNNYGVAGVAAWRLGYETSDIWGLFEAYLHS